MVAVDIELSVNYGDDLLFDNFHLRLEAGKLICLLGKSGTGKSTLLRFIAGLLPPQSANGTVIPSDKLPLQGRIAWMAQQDLLLPWLTVIDNVNIGALLRGERTKKDQKIARDLLAKVELKNIEHRYPHELSGGMRQRVALARTLIEECPLNLLDEPFSGLDAITRAQLQNLTCNLLSHQQTTLLVTHDPLEALRMADQIYVLHGCPAKVGSSVSLPNNSPRELTDLSIAEAYAELMNQLSQSEPGIDDS